MSRLEPRQGVAGEKLLLVVVFVSPGTHRKAKRYKEIGGGSGQKEGRSGQKQGLSGQKEQ